MYENTFSNINFDVACMLVGVGMGGCGCGCMRWVCGVVNEWGVHVSVKSCESASHYDTI